jgi:hypothetical protein
MMRMLLRLSRPESFSVTYLVLDVFSACLLEMCLAC